MHRPHRCRRVPLHQDVASAPEFLTVEWYASVSEAVRGLEKNAFSGVDDTLFVILLRTMILNLIRGASTGGTPSIH